MLSMLCRNCLVRESPTGHLVKIADFAILRSSYSKEYRTPRTAREDTRDVDGGGNKSIDGEAQDVDHYGSGVGAKEVLPLRWIPWEVYTLVSIEKNIWDRVRCLDGVCKHVLQNYSIVPCQHLSPTRPIELMDRRIARFPGCLFVLPDLTYKRALPQSLGSPISWLDQYNP